jgi:hypothetical protein
LLCLWRKFLLSWRRRCARGMAKVWGNGVINIRRWLVDVASSSPFASVRICRGLVFGLVFFCADTSQDTLKC